MLETISRSNAAELTAAAADTFLAELERTAKGGETVVVGLPGGRSPGDILRSLLEGDRGRRFAAVAPSLQFFMADERCVPLDHPDSNYRMLKEALFDKALSEGVLTDEQIHPFVSDPSRHDFGAAAYTDEFRSFGNRFDVLLLGAGEDGHIAGLFPGVSYELPADGFLPFSGSPKPPSDRMTASTTTLLRSGYAMLLFLGDAKREAYEQFKQGRTPSALVRRLPRAVVVTDLE